jgi:mannitol/fructose-specific phosphotransferase system IIA component (Ntr-type)
MQLTEILLPECVKVPLEGTTKKEVIFELVDLLSEHTGIANPDELKDAVWQREMTRTTGIGNHIAIPHGKCRGCKKLRMAVGKTAQPIDFGAIDNKPVELVLLLASPIDQTGPHIQALGSISRMMHPARVRAELRRADTAEELYRLIEHFDAKAAASG